MWIYVLLIFVLLLVYLSLKPHNFPPGPPSLPIVGSLLFLKDVSRIPICIEKAQEKYGPIIGAKFGVSNVILIGGGAEALEALRADVFLGRPRHVAILPRHLSDNGLLQNEGPLWHVRRRYTIRQLRDLGFGKSFMELPILEEIESLIESQFSGNVVEQATEVFYQSIINIIWTVMGGKRFDNEDEEFIKMISIVRSGTKTPKLYSKLHFFIDSVCYKLGIDRSLICMEELEHFIQNQIDEHKTSPPDEPQDFIDAYLRKINDVDIDNEIINEKTLQAICIDFFFAGVDTTANSLSFALMYCVLYPEIQAQIAEEIRTVLGGRTPRIFDRTQLAHVEAFLSEVARINTVVPVLPRRAMKDTMFNGYFIAEKTSILISIVSIHMNKEHWGDPEVFRPSRFLDDKGNYRKDDWCIPFGTGKRQCPGEGISKDMQFLMLTRLLQEFEFGSPTDAEPPNTMADYGLTNSPAPFSVTLKRRLKN